MRLASDQYSTEIAQEPNPFPHVFWVKTAVDEDVWWTARELAGVDLPDFYPVT